MPKIWVWKLRIPQWELTTATRKRRATRKSLHGPPKYWWQVGPRSVVLKDSQAWREKTCISIVTPLLFPRPKASLGPITDPFWMTVSRKALTTLLSLLPAFLIHCSTEAKEPSDFSDLESRGKSPQASYHSVPNTFLQISFFCHCNPTNVPPTDFYGTSRGTQGFLFPL